MNSRRPSKTSRRPRNKKCQSLFSTSKRPYKSKRHNQKGEQKNNGHHARPRSYPPTLASVPDRRHVHLPDAEILHPVTPVHAGAIAIPVDKFARTVGHRGNGINARRRVYITQNRHQAEPVQHRGLLFSKLSQITSP